MKIEMMKIKDLIPYEKNAKRHNRQQIQNVAESIRRFGFAQPLVVDKDNVLFLDGHVAINTWEFPINRKAPLFGQDAFL